MGKNRRKSSMKKIVVALFALMFPALAVAQTAPFTKTSRNVSSTIAVTNTFQSVLSETRGRASCMVQNNGSNSMYVYFGAIASATLANSVKLAAGQAVSCTAGGVVLTDQVSITGTSADAYYAAEQ